MRNLIAYALTVLFCIGIIGCFRNEIKTTDYKVYKMTTPAAAAFIQERIKTLDGVLNISYNLSNTSLTVTYNTNKLRKMNIEEAIALCGFDVNNRPANPQAKAKLPKGLLKP